MTVSAVGMVHTGEGNISLTKVGVHISRVEQPCHVGYCAALLEIRFKGLGADACFKPV